MLYSYTAKGYGLRKTTEIFVRIESVFFLFNIHIYIYIYNIYGNHDGSHILIDVYRCISI